MPAPPPTVVVPSAAPPPVETLDNEGKYRRAEQLAERRNFEEAMRIVDELIARDATSADYHAAARVDPVPAVHRRRSRRARCIDAIERALRLNEEHARALYVKGSCSSAWAKRAKRCATSQRTLEADPRHLEAKRELRLGQDAPRP